MITSEVHLKRGNINVPVPLLITIESGKYESRSSRLRRKSWCSFPACGSLKRQCGDQDQDLEVTIILNLICATLAISQKNQTKWTFMLGPSFYLLHWSCSIYKQIVRMPNKYKKSTGCWAPCPTVPGASFYCQIWGGGKKAKDYPANHTQGKTAISSLGKPWNKKNGKKKGDIVPFRRTPPLNG